MGVVGVVASTMASMASEVLALNLSGGLGEHRDVAVAVGEVVGCRGRESKRSKGVRR